VHPFISGRRREKVPINFESIPKPIFQPRMDTDSFQRKDAKSQRRKGFGNHSWQSWVSPFCKLKLPGCRRSDFAVPTLRLGRFAVQSVKIIARCEDFSASPMNLAYQGRYKLLVQVNEKFVIKKGGVWLRLCAFAPLR